MMYLLSCWRCRAKIESTFYVSMVICDDCLSAFAKVREAIKMVRLANKHAFTFAHPAYRSAEEKIMALSTAEAAIVLQETGGLKPVIGRGLRAS